MKILLSPGIGTEDPPRYTTCCPAPLIILTEETDDMIDPKDVYNEAFADAIEDGHNGLVAHDIAEKARNGAEDTLIDDAMNRLKELP